MKPRTTSRFRTGLISSAVIVLALVSWSPTPTGTNIVMNGGALLVNPAGGTNSVPAVTKPVALIGQSNNSAGNGFTITTTGCGLVVGTLNEFGTVTGGGWQTYSAVIGESNLSSTRSSLLVGLGNNASTGASGTDISTSFSGIFGQGNTTNSVQSSLIAGENNTMGVVSSAARTSGSAIIGSLSLVDSTAGWSVGHANKVSADRGVALGTGLKTIQPDSTALGRYNAEMQTNDVLAVGSGSSDADSDRFTALRITNDGGVILGRAQGDISMGAYGN